MAKLTDLCTIEVSCLTFQFFQMRHHSRQLVPISAYVICFLAVASLTLVVTKGSFGGTPTSTPTPTPVVSSTPSSSPTPSPSATPISTPTPTPSASVSAELPAVVTTFYSAYRQQNVELIFQQFTAPATNDERELLSLLKDGKDLQGIPGGPTLFQSASVTFTITKVTLVSATSTNITVDETVTSEGVETMRRRLFTLSGAKIASYKKSTSDGKYSGFFN